VRVPAGCYSLLTPDGDLSPPAFGPERDCLEFGPVSVRLSDRLGWGSIQKRRVRPMSVAASAPPLKTSMLARTYALQSTVQLLFVAATVMSCEPLWCGNSPFSATGDCRPFGALQNESQGRKVLLKCRDTDGVMSLLDKPVCPEGSELIGAVRG
jgi:hypothetical protein